MDKPQYKIILRACDIVEAASHSKRPFGLNKKQIIQASFLSLLDALKNENYQMRIIGDRLSPEMVSFFEKYTSTRIILENSLEKLGNAGSLKRCLELAYDSNPEEWVYLCEDDYVHVADAFSHITELIMNREEIMAFHRKKPQKFIENWLFSDLPRKSLFLHLPDYVDRYTPDQRRFSFLFLTSRIHWRQISNTTWSFLAQAKDFHRFRKVLDHAAKGANDSYLSRNLYGRLHFIGKAICLSPIPGLASHMHHDVLTPHVDWESITVKYLKEVE